MVDTQKNFILRRSTLIQIFADGSNYQTMLSLYRNRKINGVSGFTTNPSLMRKDGVVDYLSFAKGLLEEITEVPVSFEVIADDFDEMERQAKILAELGHNVYVKIPVVNTKGESSYDLIQKLSTQDIQLNVTSVFTKKQILALADIMSGDIDHIVSIFAGRIADTGRNPKKIVKFAVDIMPRNVFVLWASTREIYNIYQADKLRCDIITATSEIIEKYNSLREYDLNDYTVDTVQMFYNDALSARYEL